MIVRSFLATLALVALPLAAQAQEAADAVAPEAATDTAFAGASPAVQAALDAKQAGETAVAQDWMVAAANPLAVQAGADILAAGGTAADAMVAVQAVLGLVEPQSSGLGGGAFLVWFDAASGTVTTLDGRETAPRAATPRLFQDADGEPLQFFDAVVGGRSVGTPGTPALMEEAHRRWGTANWGSLFGDAIALAEFLFHKEFNRAAGRTKLAWFLLHAARNLPPLFYAGDPLWGVRAVANHRELTAALRRRDPGS